MRRLVRGSKKIRLVVVDDHPMVLQGIRMFMAGDPAIHWSGEAATGREALELCRLVEPDVVIVDMRLPDQDGLSLAQQLRERQPDLQIILVSGHLDAEILQQARSMGVHDVLHKEAQAHELRQVVHRCGQPKRRSAQLHGSLTRREIEVLALIGRGFGNQEIRNLAPSDGVVVSATLHSLTASTTLTQIPPTDATVASILVSPVRTGLRGIDTAPFQLSASAVTQSGVSYDITNQVKWSSSNTAALNVSAQGVATPVLPYGVQTIVTVSATYQGVTGSGKVVIP